jgi:hypothetical protein
MRKIRFYLPRLLCSIALLCCFAGSVGAQSTISASDNSPVSIVRRYCNLDLDGARLSSQNPNNDAITKLATWPIEPGWDTTVVVNAFEIVSTSTGPKQSSVTVRYSVLGNMFGAKVAQSQKQKELVTFVLTKSPGGWLIQRPLIAPHVSVSAAIFALHSLLDDEKDAEQIKRLNAGIDLLTKWKNGTGLSKAP